jgi:hypothetical protein
LHGRSEASAPYDDTDENQHRCVAVCRIGVSLRALSFNQTRRGTVSCRRGGSEALVLSHFGRLEESPSPFG